ncbi:MAG: glycosyltransferase family 2 protein, partial [Bauldia sp.]|nr:glycosyltransferase family 2 protein [Bauldia sp.]
MPNDDSPTPNIHHDPLEAAAIELSNRQSVSLEPPLPIAVWAQLGLTRIWLERARSACAEPPPTITKAAEWLLDNDHRIEHTLRQIAEDLPPAFYQRLPRLIGAEEAGLPRAFALAHGLLRASYLQLSLTGAVRFVEAYQERSPLTIAELWTLPTMLRLACLETLIAAFARLIPELKPPFDLSPSAAAPASLEDTECVSRSIANLTVLSSIPWKDFFDQTSRVEAILRTDPAGFYRQMDFATRDRYRKVVEELAHGSKRNEPDVASYVVAKARTGLASQPRDLFGHWLVGDGREQLEAELGCHPPARVVWNRRLLRHAPILYAGALAAASVGALLLPAFYLAAEGASLPVWLLGIAVAAVPASVLGVTAVNWIVTLIAPPRLLPKLDFKDGIPPDCATAVVVPVILGKPDAVRQLLDRLEAHRLANPDPSLQFILLSDFPDAPAELMPDDDALVAVLIDGVRRLNERCKRDENNPFHLLHRPRRYNPAEGIWMGWERKRGKLEQFNDFVASGDASTFSPVEGDLDALRGLRFVVTVDADTTLPPGSVSQLVGALAHPLNRAEFDAKTGRVARGYTIIQPRIEIAPDIGNRSLFARLYTGDTAIDIYSRAVSNVYQDLFGSGIFAGKGIYEVTSFRRSCFGRVPENALLSHDLFEGVHGRTALASDIVLYENFPAGYGEYARRRHRWVRGDWQLLPWLARRVPYRSGERRPNQLSGLDRWKILDNLRRSLIPPALIAFAAIGWLVLPGSPWMWTALTVAAPGGYLLTDLVTGMSKGRRQGAVEGVLRQFRNHAGAWLLAVVFLANDAAVACDAILRTLWRLVVTRRRLLQWVSASDAAAHFASRNSRADFWRQMWLAPLLSIMLAVAIWLVRPVALLPASLLLAVWLTAPEIAALVSRPRRSSVERLDSKDHKFLRRVARRNWLYFETFVGPDDNWLPPDNFQEDPYKEIAHRTSPTNVGMMFLSFLVAWDLGFVGLIDFATRIRHGLDALGRLERHRGHFFNWYDTRLLSPLEPRYVSTVDSGNLAACLVALKEGCAEAVRGPVLHHEMWDGLSDTLDLLRESLEKTADGYATDVLTQATAIAELIIRARDDPAIWRPVVARISDGEFPKLKDAVAEAIAVAQTPRPEALHEIHVWLERVQHHLIAMQRRLELLFPWLVFLEAPPPGYGKIAGHVAEILKPALSLADSDESCRRALALLADASAATAENDDVQRGHWTANLKAAIEAGAHQRRELCEALRDIATRSESLAFEMDFRFLFDREQRLFHIGYNASSRHLDPNHYDLLATEARLASFFAIAKRDVPYEHWFFLGRPLARLAGGLSLVSWNGSMFEYLMPALLIRSIQNTLLGETERTAVDAQR